MKNIKLILICATLIMFNTLSFAQSDFTVTEENIGDEQVLVRIEHTNGRYVEHLVSGQSGDLSVNILNEAFKDP